MKIFSSVFFSSFNFLFSSMIHFKLIFVYNVR